MPKDKQRNLRSFASSKKGSHCIPSAFNINQTYKLGRSQTCHINDMSQRKHWYMREKNTPQSTMGLLNRVECIVLENLPVLIQIINRFCCRKLGLEIIYIFRVFSVCLSLLSAFLSTIMCILLLISDCVNLVLE